MSKYDFFHARVDEDRRIFVMIKNNGDHWLLEYIKPSFLFDLTELRIFCYNVIRNMIQHDNFNMILQEKQDD